MEIIWHEVDPNPAANIDESNLPPLDHPVSIMAFGGRADVGEGWLWGIQEYGGHAKGEEGETSGIICDDEYRVTHWAEIPWPLST